MLASYLGESLMQPTFCINHQLSYYSQENFDLYPSLGNFSIVLESFPLNTKNNFPISTRKFTSQYSEISLSVLWNFPLNASKFPFVILLSMSTCFSYPVLDKSLATQCQEISWNQVEIIIILDFLQIITKPRLSGKG